MEELVSMIKKEGGLKKQAPLLLEKVIESQKELVKSGFVMLPSEFVDFLRIYNGVRADACAILGVEPEDAFLDIVSFNKLHNAAEDKVILGYDDFCFLVYDASRECYLLLDREDGEELDDFSKDSLAYALSAILHF